MRASIPGTLKALRQEAVEILQETQAIETLANLITPQRVTDFGEMRELVLVGTSRKRLKHLIAELKESLIELRASCVVHANRQQLIDFLNYAQSGPSEKVLYIDKFRLRRLLGLYDNSLWPQQHCYLMVDPQGVMPRHPNIELRLLEATLFEDLCAIFNLAKERTHEAELNVYHKRKVKTAEALRRAAVSAAFYFVEAYLNGLAFHYLATHIAVDQKIKDMLTEWDSTKNQRRYLKLRQKLLNYPRIVLGAEHAPLQENNCEEMRLFLTKAKLIRDAIVHASPAPDQITKQPDKDILIFTLEMKDVEEVVDASIALVRKLELAMKREPEFIKWLCERNPSGYFPESAFT